MHARDGQDGHFTLGGARLALFLGGALVTAAIFGAALQRYITPILPAVREAMLPYLGDEWGNPSTIQETATNNSDRTYSRQTNLTYNLDPKK